MTELYDLIVVGGGPAGSAAALRARQLRLDARVLLLDAADFPRDKACGDDIAPHPVDELSVLGVTDAVVGYPPIRRLRVGSPGGAEVMSAPARPNYVVPRKVFDARLVAAAAAAGVEVRRHRVHHLTVGRARVELDAAVAGRVVIGADGANSTVRRQAGVARSPAKHTAIAVRGYAPAPAGTPEQRIAMVAQGLAGVRLVLSDRRRDRERRLRQARHAGRRGGPQRASRALRPAGRAAAGLPRRPGHPAGAPPAAVQRSAAPARRPGAARRRRAQPDQPADRRGDLLRAAVGPAGCRGGGGGPDGGREGLPPGARPRVWADTYGTPPCWRRPDSCRASWTPP